MSENSANLTPKVEEAEKKETSIDFEAVLAFLRQRGLRETESLLQRELNVAASSTPGGGDQAGRPSQDVKVESVTPAVTPAAVAETGSEVTNVLTSYKSDGDPSIYGDAYQVRPEFHLLGNPLRDV